jgi:adenine deaminase
VITGTDSPIDHTAVSTHMNLRAMVAYGLTPFEALTTATSVPGQVLGEPLGRIVAGGYADLAVLGGDPLTDITQAANVRQVVANGTVFDVDTLLAPFATGTTAGTTAGTTVGTTAAPASVLLPPVPENPANRAYWWHDPHYVASGRNSCCTGV